MRRLFVIACNKGTDIYILNKRGAWVHRDTADENWWRHHEKPAAQRSLPECPTWATNVRVCVHAFMGVP